MELMVENAKADTIPEVLHRTATQKKTAMYVH